MAWVGIPFALVAYITLWFDRGGAACRTFGCTYRSNLSLCPKLGFSRVRISPVALNLLGIAYTIVCPHSFLKAPPMLRRQFQTRILVMAVSTVAACAFSASAMAQSALDDVMKAKVLKVAVQTDSAPYGYVGTDLKPIGLDIDLANYIGKKMGVAVELVQVVSASRIPSLQTKKADIVIATLGKNPEREKVIDFTAAYAPFYMAVFGPKSMSIKSFADLSGKSVGVVRGALEDQELGKVAPAGVDIKRFEDFNASIAAFVSGQVQLAAMGASVAGNMMVKNPQLAAEYKLLLKDSPCFIGVAKGEDALKTKVNAILAEAKASGELDNLSKKWLGRTAGDLPL
jgi:polar amino acid transport system substrate-binding protein